MAQNSDELLSKAIAESTPNAIKFGGLSIFESKLRFFSAEGQLIPTPEEAAKAEEQQREEAEQQLSQAEQQLTEMESLLARYRERFGE